MKRIVFTAAMFVFLFLAPAYGDQESAANGKPASESGSEIEITEKDDVTIFTISGSSPGGRKESAASYLTRYYFEKGGFREVVISCFLSIETAFPSDEYDAASRQVLEIYDAFVDKGISEDDLYLSVRFEKNIMPDGMITVEFLNHAGYFQRAGRNFVTGITDIISSPFELPMGMVSESRKSGPVTGLPKGVFSGFGQALRKAGTGTIKLLTFWAG